MKPPCMKNGHDCEKRRAGCQVECEDYKEFQKWVVSERTKRYNEGSGGMTSATSKRLGEWRKKEY